MTGDLIYSPINNDRSKNLQTVSTILAPQEKTVTSALMTASTKGERAYFAKRHAAQESHSTFGSKMAAYMRVQSPINLQQHKSQQQ